MTSYLQDPSIPWLVLRMLKAPVTDENLKNVEALIKEIYKEAYSQILVNVPVVKGGYNGN